MRARYAQGGLDGFAPHEALELLLFYAIPQRNVNPIAHRLIEQFGSLGAVLEASPARLQEVQGIGENAAALLSLVLPLARHAERERQAARAVITNFGQAKNYCHHLFDGLAEEVLFVVCLDAQGRVIRAVPALKGTIDEIAVYPRAVVSAALSHHAHAVVLAHNHPSGVPDPSEADIAVTERLREALGMVDIQLMDHIVCADGVCVSMQQWQRERQARARCAAGRETKAADAQKRQ